MLGWFWVISNSFPKYRNYFFFYWNKTSPALLTELKIHQLYSLQRGKTGPIHEYDYKLHLVVSRNSAGVRHHPFVASPRVVVGVKVLSIGQIDLVFQGMTLNHIRWWGSCSEALRVHIFTQTFRYNKDVTEGQFLSGLVFFFGCLTKAKVWFLCLMAHQPSWVIWCQSHPGRRTAVVLFKVSLFNGILAFVGYFLPKPFFSSGSIEGFFV